MYVGSTDSSGYLMIVNPFGKADATVFATVLPNGMTDLAGRVFTVFPWDVSSDRFKMRIRREDNHAWINQQAVRVQWVAFR